MLSLVGILFPQKFNSKIDFKQGFVQLSSEEHPLPPFCSTEPNSLDDSNDDVAFVCSVHADFSFVVPPESEVVISAKLNTMPKSKEVCDLVVPRSDLPSRYSIFGASELVKATEDGSIPIRMVNPCAKPVKIYRRPRLADFEAVDQSIATFQLNDSVQTASSTENVELQSPQNDYSNLPDLADSVLNDDDQVKVQNRFRKYCYVFAFSDDQLGRTSLVQHVIDTGDAVPIKQKPYRTTPDNKQEIDRQVGEMLKKGIKNLSLLGVHQSY